MIFTNFHKAMALVVESKVIGVGMFWDFAAITVGFINLTGQASFTLSIRSGCVQNQGQVVEIMLECGSKL